VKEFTGIEGTNFFGDDQGLKSLLADLLPDNQRDDIFGSLSRFGELAGGSWNDLAAQASRPENLPRIVKYDRAGNPVERIEFGRLTAQLRREVAESGLLTRTHSEVQKFAMIYLLAHNGEASLTCPISCTDGLVYALEAKGLPAPSSLPSGQEAPTSERSKPPPRPMETAHGPSPVKNGFARIPMNSLP